MELVATKNMGVLGRIVIPSDVRDTYGLQPGTLVGIYIDNNRVVLKPIKKDKNSINFCKCDLCEKVAKLKKVGDLNICYSCLDGLIKVHQEQEGK